MSALPLPPPAPSVDPADALSCAQARLAKVAFEARFMGRTMAYTYEIKEYVPGQSLVMSTAAGPFAMETSYTFSETPSGATIVELRNRGRPSGTECRRTRSWIRQQ